MKLVIASEARRDTAVLGFELTNDSLLCLGDMDEPASTHVAAFDPKIDVFYRSPEQLAPHKLEEEIRIHFPDHLLERSGKRVVAGSLQGAVLLQPRPMGEIAISPLAALTEVIEKVGDVNSAILEAANGGLLFVRRSGDHITAHFSTHSIAEFAALSEKARDEVFPDFSAIEIIISGMDALHFKDLDLGAMKIARRISIDDLLSMTQFSEAALKIVELEPERYTLAIGTASIMAAIAKEVSNL